MTNTCLVKVTHTYEFHQSPNKSLRPALRSIFKNGVCSDLNLVVGDKSFAVNKCIIAVRSVPLAAMLRKDPSVTQLVLECDQDPQLFETLLYWVYSANAEMPEDLLAVIELYFMAYDFQVLDLM